VVAILEEGEEGVVVASDSFWMRGARVISTVDIPPRGGGWGYTVLVG